MNIPVFLILAHPPARSVVFTPRFLLAVISLSASDRSNAASEATEEVKKKVEA